MNRPRRHYPMTEARKWKEGHEKGEAMKQLEISMNRWIRGRIALSSDEHAYLAMVFHKNEALPIGGTLSRFLRYRETPKSRQLLEKVWCNS